jgi:hypothetical protein
MGLFFRSESPGLVSRRSLQKSPMTLVLLGMPCKQFDGSGNKSRGRFKMAFIGFSKGFDRLVGNTPF